jgi:hypothetical protein
MAIAAYMLLQGYEILDIQGRKRTFNNGDKVIYYIEFNIPNIEGRKISEPFYQNFMEIRNKLWEFRKNEQNDKSDKAKPEPETVS